MTPSKQQQAAIDEIISGNGHLMIKALAGTGKTSLLMMLLPYVEGNVFLGAFNVPIKDELIRRVGLMRLPNCECDIKTIHGAGMGAFIYGGGDRNAKTEKDKVYFLLDELAAHDDAYSTYRNFLSKLVGYGKRAGIGCLVPNEPASWRELIDYYSVDDEIPTHVSYGYDEDEDGELIDNLIAYARNLYDVSLERCRRHTVGRDKSNGWIDFDDMLLSPIHYNCNFKKYDWVFIDEVQDNSPIRQEISIRMLRPKTGRMVAVGDENQCQPAGTAVWSCVAKGKGRNGGKHDMQAIPIEDIKTGDTVISFNLSDSAFILQREVLGTAKRRYKGQLIVADAGAGYMSKYTPDHICVASFKPLDGQHAVYLMLKNGKFRVGISPMFYGETSNNACGPVSRMHAEKADAVWILDVYPDRKTAAFNESIIGANFGLPLLMFGPKNNSVWTEEEFSEVWSNIHSNQEQAVRCLSAFGRLLEFPFASSGVRNALGDEASRTLNGSGPLNTSRRMSKVRACNLITGVSVIVYKGGAHSSVSDRSEVVSISREDYDGYVYSLSVDGEKLYCADGIITHNCIYGFTGSQHDAMSVLQQRLDMKVLPLSVTYRCPKKVVAIANQWVPELEAHESAPEGVIRTVWLEPRPCVYCNGTGKLTVACLGNVDESVPCGHCDGKGKEGPGFWDEAATLNYEDVILCRNNRPVVELAYQLLRKNIPCKIEGRDFASSLIKLCQRWKVKELNALESKLTTFKDKEAAKWRLKNNEERATGVEDKVDTLLTLLGAVREGGKTRVSDLVDRIDQMFSTKDGERPRMLTLSSVHKWKGKESKRVYILGRARYMPSQWALKSGQKWQIKGENNLLYVAVTRSMSELIDIVIPDTTRRREV